MESAIKSRKSPVKDSHDWSQWSEWVEDPSDPTRLKRTRTRADGEVEVEEKERDPATNACTEERLRDHFKGDREAWEKECEGYHKSKKEDETQTEYKKKTDGTIDLKILPPNVIEQEDKEIKLKTPKTRDPCDPTKVQGALPWEGKRGGKWYKEAFLKDRRERLDAGEQDYTKEELQQQYIDEFASTKQAEIDRLQAKYPNKSYSWILKHACKNVKPPEYEEEEKTGGGGGRNRGGGGSGGGGKGKLKEWWQNLKKEKCPKF